MAFQPVFLKVTNNNGVLVLIPIKPFPVSGITTAAVLPAVPRMQPTDMREFEVWATNSLFKKDGYYVCGNILYRVCDEIGLIDTKYTDKIHEALCNSYNAFVSGKDSMVDEDFSTATFSATSKQHATAPVAEKKKPKLLDKIKSDRSLKPPTVDNDGWFVDPDLWYYLIRQMSRNKNTLLVGNSGTGKTELIMFVAERLKKTLNIFDMAVANPYKTFCGNLRADNGTTSFQYARFAQVIQQPGINLLDELSRAAPTANNIFLPVFDGRRTLYIEDAIDQSMTQIKVHSEAMFWATANIGAEFIGTNTLDHALLNRFSMVPVNYPPEAQEAKVLIKRCDISDRDATGIVKCALAIRTNKELSKDVSTRQLIEVAELVNDGYSISKAFEWAVLAQFESNDIDGGERATVKSIIQGF